MIAMIDHNGDGDDNDDDYHENDDDKYNNDNYDHPYTYNNAAI